MWVHTPTGKALLPKLYFYVTDKLANMTQAVNELYFAAAFSSIAGAYSARCMTDLRYNDGPFVHVVMDFIELICFQLDQSYSCNMYGLGNDITIGSFVL